ncbi:DNA alkylation repair protein [Gemella sp. GH3]|uniref:DNA alkylation repair protein n=1 Tax=unclassified Gemella TaxID=2624949 RepID=UPI0015D0CDE0|nr:MULTISPECIES: DNA alkylation repair protein [unclassified Gemella]MBF0714285.1 DNA alkylation repair protein [Gemella sp. GH3.1]NYS51237.1 DNA alkylation repair protein [Gemella sp. GH3]
MIKDVLTELENKSNKSVIKRYEKNNEPKPYYGVLKGEINKIAKKLKINNKLAKQLWETKNLDAMLLAVQLFDSQKLNINDIDFLVNKNISLTVLDSFTEKVIFNSLCWKDIMNNFSTMDSIIYNRLSWKLRVKYFASKQATNEEIELILKEIKENLVSSPDLVKWVMNHCLVTIAINYDNYLEYCISLGEELSVYKDQKVSKGCTSAYAPDWIAALLNRKNK